MKKQGLNNDSSSSCISFKYPSTTAAATAIRPKVGSLITKYGDKEEDSGYNGAMLNGVPKCTAMNNERHLIMLTVRYDGVSIPCLHNSIYRVMGIFNNKYIFSLVFLFVISD